MGLKTLEIILSLVTKYQIDEESILQNSSFESLVLMLLLHVKYMFRVITLYDFSLPINLIIKQKPFRINSNNTSTSISSNSNPYSYFRDENNEEFLLLDFDNSINILNVKSSNSIDGSYSYYSNKYIKGNSTQTDFFNLLIEYVLIIFHYILSQALNVINLFGLLNENTNHIENYHYLKNLNEYLKYLILQEEKMMKSNSNKLNNSNLMAYKKIPELILSRFLEKVKSYSTEIEDLISQNPNEKENFYKVMFKSLLLTTGEIRTNYFLSQETNPTVLLLSVEALISYYKLQLKDLKNSQDFDFSKLEKITQSYEFLVRIIYLFRIFS